MDPEVLKNMMPHWSEFNESQVVMGNETELAKVRKAMEINHPLIRAFRKTWKNIAGEGGKEEKFLLYLQQLDEEEGSSDQERADAGGMGSPLRALESPPPENPWISLRSQAVIGGGREREDVGESSRGRFEPASHNSRDFQGIHAGDFQRDTRRHETSRGSRHQQRSPHTSHRRRHHRSSSESSRDRRRRKRKERRRARHEARRARRGQGSPLPRRNPGAPGRAPRNVAAGVVAEELPTLKLNTFTWEPVEIDEVGLSHRVAKCVDRMYPDWVLWAELKGDAVKYQTLLNDIMGGFTNGTSISYRHLKDKIVNYLGDRRYRWKKKVKATWDVVTSTYRRPVGMSETTYNMIVEELCAGEDTPSHRRAHMGDAANQARAAQPSKKVTNYWGQGGVKRFIATYVSSHFPPACEC